MKMTIEDAARVWCPFARVARDEGPDIVAGINRDALGAKSGPDTYDGMTLRPCRCIADRCAAWRWLPLGPEVVPEAEPYSNREGFLWLGGMAG